MLRTTLLLAALALSACAGPRTPASTASAPTPPVEPFQDKLLSGDTVKVSAHVWAIIGWPNIGIVVGQTGTLVVDTGLGKENGAIVAKAARALAPSNRLYVTTTHFHPEHAGGILGFPADAHLVRDRVQEEEMTQHGEEMIQRFAGLRASWKALLVGEQLRPADETFDRELRLDLGGVTARLLWFGSAHTKGDEVVFVDPDATLISGDVVQNKVAPFIRAEGATTASWISVVDQIAKLGVEHVLPDHSAVGDGSLVAQERAFLVDVREHALARKHDGVSADQAGKELTADFKTRYPGWDIEDLGTFVKAAYAE